MLYVANCTKQEHNFTYRVPEVGTVKMQPIKMGAQQVIFSKDAPRHILNAIIEQYAPYGIVEVSDIDQTRDFRGLVYSFDKPIPVDKIMRTHATNEAVLEAKGAEWRKESAIALSNELQKREDGNSLRTLEVEVIEEGKKGTPTSNSELIEVTQQGVEPRSSREPVQSRRGRKRT
jgi:hypothetical protein